MAALLRFVSLICTRKPRGEWCTFPCCALELPLLVYLRFLRDIADVKVDEGLFSVACYGEVEVPKQSVCCKSVVAQAEANK